MAPTFTGVMFFVIRETSFSAFSIKTLVFNKRATELIDKQEILFGTRTKSYKLNEIVLDKKEGIDDENGSRYYEPTLVLPSGKTHRLLYTYQQEKALLMIQQIKKFLPHVNS